jgi:hypothetical protein
VKTAGICTAASDNRKSKRCPTMAPPRSFNIVANSIQLMIFSYLAKKNPSPSFPITEARSKIPAGRNLEQLESVSYSTESRQPCARLLCHLCPSPTLATILHSHTGSPLTTPQHTRRDTSTGTQASNSSTEFATSHSTSVPGLPSLRAFSAYPPTRQEGAFHVRPAGKVCFTPVPTRTLSG